MMSLEERAVEELHAAQAAGHSSHLLILPPVTASEASHVLAKIRKEGFTPAAQFKGGAVVDAKARGLSLEVAL